MWLLRNLRWRIVGMAVLGVFNLAIICSLNTREQVLSSNTDSTSRIKNRKLFPSSFKNGAPQARKGSSANYSIPEVDDFIKTFSKFSSNSGNTVLRLNVSEPYLEFLTRVNVHKKKGVMLVELHNATGRANNSIERFHQGINQFYLYDPLDGQNLVNLLKDLNSQPVMSADTKGDGTQFKMWLTFPDGGKGIFKPMKTSRGEEEPSDVPYYHYVERHTSEIAAFHLDRVLGFHRVPPTVGRVLNMTRDIRNVSTTWISDTFFTNSDGRLCFVGRCRQFCDKTHPICGTPDTLEGSVSVRLPLSSQLLRKLQIHPWRRSYFLNKTAVWENDDTYCDTHVRVVRPYNESRLLLDLMDMSVFDFFIDNMDRHHFEAFRDFWPDAFIIQFDHGRGFIKANADCLSCLAPVRQCCLIRYSTLVKLIKLYRGPDSLSQVMRTSLNSDPLAPILTEPHLDALDRRVGLAVKVIVDCLRSGKRWEEVIVDDGFT